MPEADSTQNQIEQRLAELPQDVQDAVLSAQLGDRVREIGQKHGLHIDQAAVLQDEVMLVMLGFFQPEEFSNQIATQLRVPATDAAAIAQDVNQQIFLPIQDSMKRFAESKRPGQERTVPIRTEPAQKVPSPAAPPPPAMPNAEKMLTETTVAKPIYKNDPYREPIEP